MDDISKDFVGYWRRVASISFDRDRFSILTRRRSEAAIVWFLPAFAASVYAITKGQDLNWDQRNYHIYSVYSLLHHRGGFDIIPSQLQTWTNPVGNLFQYLLVMSLRPTTASVLLAFLASTSIPLVYFLTKATLNDKVDRQNGFHIIVPGIAAMGAFFSPVFLSEVGTTFNDYLGSIVILLAIWVSTRNRLALGPYFLAGALLGVAVAIKLTNAFLIFGWVAAVVAVEKTNAMRPLVLSGAAAVATYIPLGGVWNAHVYSLFRNPLFPLYNHIFKSDAYAHAPMLDERFKPKTFAAALEYFTKWTFGEPTTTEVVFRDARFLLALLVLALALPRVIELVFAHREDRAPPIFDRKRSLFVLVFTIVSFVAWLAMFGIERYAILLEQLALIVILILLSLLCENRRVFAQAALMSLALILATTQPPDWGRAPFTKDWYAVAAPAPLLQNETLFVMLSGEPTAYVIPYLPASDSFVRIEGNMPLDPAVGLGEVALARIRAHKGVIRTLAPADYSLEQSKQRLASFDLAIREEDCLFISTKVEKLRSCRLTRS